MQHQRRPILVGWSALTLIGVLLVSVWSVRVMAESSSSITTLSKEDQEKLKDNQKRLDEIKSKIKAYNEIIGLKQKQGTALQSQISSLEAQASKLELEISHSQNRIETLKTDIGALEQRIAEKERRILSDRSLLAEMMRTASLSSETGLARLLAEAPEDLGLTLKSEEWSMQTGDRLGRLLGEIQIVKQDIEKERTALDQKRAEESTLQEQLGKQSDYLASSKNSKAALLTKTQTEVKKYNTVVDQLQDEKDAIENEIESLESNKVGELNLKDMPSFKRGTLAYPVKKVVFSQGYGKTAFAKTSKFYGTSGFHNGLDFAMPTGTSVLAAADGKIIARGNNGRYAYGRWIAIDHGNGIVTMYGHLSAYAKDKGDKVKQGDTIAKSGNTGNSTGPHLHFTVFSAKSFEIVPSKSVSSVKDIPIGATVNPKNYLP